MDKSCSKAQARKYLPKKKRHHRQPSQVCEVEEEFTFKAGPETVKDVINHLTFKNFDKKMNCIIEKVRKRKTKCAIKSCPNKISVIGKFCRYCAYIYCSFHRSPKAHDCPIESAKTKYKYPITLAEIRRARLLKIFLEARQKTVAARRRRKARRKCYQFDKDPPTVDEVYEEYRCKCYWCNCSYSTIS